MASSYTTSLIWDFITTDSTTLTIDAENTGWDLLAYDGTDNISINSGSNDTFIGYNTMAGSSRNDKIVFQLKNKHIEVNDKDMFLDLKNDTLVILEKDNFYNLKVYKISSLKLETEAREPVKVILNNKSNKKLLTEKFKKEETNLICACSTYATLTDISDVCFCYNGLECKITQSERNVYIDVENNIAYICNGKEFLEYKIKNFEVEVYSQENLSKLKEKKEKRILLIEKNPKPLDFLIGL